MRRAALLLLAALLAIPSGNTALAQAPPSGPEVVFVNEDSSPPDPELLELKQGLADRVDTLATSQHRLQRRG